MENNKLDDGDLNFPDYPLGNSKDVSETYSLQLDSNVSDSKFTKPWVIKEGYITVFGRTLSQEFDETWPAGSNAVLLGPLAGGLPRGILSQKITVSSESSFFLYFHARVTVADKNGSGPCQTAQLQISIENIPLKIITCETEWKQNYVIMDVPQGKSSIDISFRDVSENIPKVDCVAAIASLKLMSFDVKGATLVKILGDEQFSYLNEDFKDEVTVELLNGNQKPIPSIPINFDVTSGDAQLNGSGAKSVTVISDPSSGRAAVKVSASVTGLIKVTVSVSGVQSVTFDLFVGRNRGDVSIVSEPMPITVRPLKAGSEKTSLIVRSASQPIILLPYFKISEGVLTDPYSFDETDVVRTKSPLGKADSAGKMTLVKIFSKQVKPVEKDLICNFEGGTESMQIVCRH